MSDEHSSWAPFGRADDDDVDEPPPPTGPVQPEAPVQEPAPEPEPEPPVQEPAPEPAPNAEPEPEPPPPSPALEEVDLTPSPLAWPAPASSAPPPPVGDWPPPVASWPPPAPAGYTTPARVPGTATASLVLGIAGLVLCPFFPSVAAIILGLQAKREIELNPQLGGRAVAGWGIGLGIAGVAVWLMVGVVFMAVVGTAVSPD